jgi:filamin/ABP280 repeat protein
LIRAGGDGQRGEVSTALAESLAVKAVDRFGNGVKDVEVSWEADGGSVSATSVMTGADGRSAVQRTLGDRPGAYGTTATATELDDSQVGFTATAVAAPSPALVITAQPSPAASAGVPLAQQPQLQLQDPTGAPLAREDVRVTVAIASGVGSLGGPTTAKSDASGRVVFNDLSIRGAPGTRTLIFVADGFSPATSTPIVVAPGPPALDRSSASVPNGTAGAVTLISIRLVDEFDNGVEGAAGLVSVTVSGSNPLGLPIVEEGNGAYSASYTPVHAGADQVDIRVSGTPLNNSPFTSNVVAGPASPATSTADVPAGSSLFVHGTITVYTRDAQSNLLGRGGEAVAITFVHRDSGTRIDVRGEIRDNGDGTYTVNYSQPGLGVFDVEITLNGSPIQGSPYQTIVVLF